MKKITALFMSCFLAAGLLTSAVQAQQIGLKGGFNVSDFINADYDTDSRIGGTAGLSIDFAPMDSPVGLETGIYYTRRGIDLPVEDASLNMDYIEVPLLAKVYFGTDAPVRPHLLAGPYGAYNFNADVEMAGTTVDIQDEVREFDFGVMFGLGTDFNIEGVGLVLQARYAMGLTSVFDADIDDFEDFEEEERHGVFSLVLGFRF